MKKVIFSLVLFLGAVHFAPAQVNPHAIGLRLGGSGTIFGGEVSYQHGLGSANRLEFDLGLNNNGTSLSGIYQWDWNIVNDLKWYAGPGATIGWWGYNTTGYFNVGIGGQIGLEYDFKSVDVPLLMSVDVRPMWNFGNKNGFDSYSALSVRYVW